MKLKNLFAKRMMVAEGLRLPVSRHFHYSTFGVRGRYESASISGIYISPSTPGTGFFAHSSDSHSYRRFVQASRKKMDQNIFTLIFGKEPNFDKENKRIEAAFDRDLNENQKRILSSYQNVIALAKDEELLQRVVRAVKDRMHRHSNESLVSVLAHYKSSIATLEHDVKAAQVNFSSILDEKQLESWKHVVEAFDELVEARRVWSVYIEDGVQMYEQVHFDKGIFDYIQSPGDTPIIRDHNDIHYYLYPLGILEAHSSVDFSLHHWNQLQAHFAAVDISSLAVRPRYGLKNKNRKRKNDALTTLYGVTRAQVVGELSIPNLGLRFFFNHRSPVLNFVKALEEYKKILVNSD